LVCLDSLVLMIFELGIQPDHVVRSENKFYQYPILQPIANKNEKFTPQPVTNVRLSKLKNKQYLLEWDVTSENISFQAVKFIVYLFDENETNNIYKTSNIISLTGETKLKIPKKTLESGKTLIIIGVSKNNDLGNPVSIKI